MLSGGRALGWEGRQTYVTPIRASGGRGALACLPDDIQLVSGRTQMQTSTCAPQTRALDLPTEQTSSVTQPVSSQCPGVRGDCEGLRSHGHVT